MVRTPIKKDIYSRYGFRSEEDDDEDVEESSFDRYRVETITGFVRNRATYNACMNTEFQHPVAELAKLALWNLELAGLGPRLINFVHDEVNYWLFPHEIKKVVPQVEKLWLAPGKLIFPDVMLKCESGLCLHWDKHATEWPDIKWDGDIPILEEPDFVKQVYNIA